MNPNRKKKEKEITNISKNEEKQSRAYVQVIFSQSMLVFIQLTKYFDTKGHLNSDKIGLC